mmetsp:Transcript_5288/g.6794  ORF Transcript_5288/g.6794 Transcript_5288/m.6794 type:complete len:230 (-) Transcript_5288:41-730(-)
MIRQYSYSAALISLIFMIGRIDAACEPECNSQNKEFCGIDDQCHYYSCETWFQLGDVKYTGYNLTSTPMLQCEDINSDEDDYDYLGTSGIFYGCSVATGLEQKFTRQCFAELDEHTNFTCREMSTSTDFESYVDLVNNTSFSCDKDPAFLYVNWVGYDIYTEDRNVWTFSVSTTFNESLATKTIYAALESDLEPPLAPPDKVENPNGSSKLVVLTNMFTFVIFMSVVLL